ncbi:MAG: folylpolyglutamate synthase [Piccolia ochrophora]|nr:MAG: folylpolyglutamate synthase [Piccolia ochrophora]
MIELGLSRIGRLLRRTSLPWRAVHVAGTNGKGSICAHVSAMLHAAGIPSGRFTSPHLIDRWDCVTLDEETVHESVFHEAEAAVKRRDREDGIGASEFEILTATAFEIFNDAKVHVAVVEVGMGGRLDATNIIRDPLVTVISKVGLDHQGFLGNTIEEIARQKAGIMKAGVLCIVDASNDSAVRDILLDHAKQVGAGPVVWSPNDASADIWQVLPKDRYQEHERVNLACAVDAAKTVFKVSPGSIDFTDVLLAAEPVRWPGRLQVASLSGVSDRKEDVLIDGAHNVQSADVLASYVNGKVRRPGLAVTWLVAMSNGKDLAGLMSRLFATGDKLIAVEFGPVDGMPWVRPAKTADLLAEAASVPGLSLGHAEDAGSDVRHGIERAVTVSGHGPLVIAGSLYLVSDVLRLVRDGA